MIKKAYRDHFRKCESMDCSIEIPNLSKVGASFISILVSVKNSTSNSKIIRKSFERVGFSDEFGENNQLLAQFNPDTEHIRKFISNVSLLQRTTLVVQPNQRKRVRIDEI